MSISHKITSPVQLYRHLCRRIRQLPPSLQGYYQHHVRQGFNSHSDETDHERIQQIISRAVDDAEWVMKKYANQTPPSGIR